MNRILTHQRLVQVLDYDPATGKFLNKVFRRGVKGAGAIAGTVRNGGYRRIMIDLTTFQAHQLAWFYVHAVWPSGPLDHINGDPDDNRISNLRLATHSQNNANRRLMATSTSGHKGVSWIKRKGKWRAGIQKDGRAIHLGYFEDLDDAARAYEVAATQIFGQFARLR